MWFENQALNVVFCIPGQARKPDATHDARHVRLPDLSVHVMVRVDMNLTRASRGQVAKKLAAVVAGFDAALVVGEVPTGFACAERAECAVVCEHSMAAFSGGV